ncbi:TylF/MycF/NovP-related O-methyltransferase [Kiloniella sp. EL199]|uniref:TylF/MycF/NovP-related O-methyltransferase n=1 Tax=Kiloniella sp. EL199 TaxID=2107581 RepID=UPI000EA3B138|nr:TylF/MycF/NovP-related O-methyltransferase [Kiloniella sp. EL199]
MGKRGITWGIDQYHLNKIWKKYRNLTMISKKQYLDNLALVKYYVNKNHLERYSIIECGTWQGGLSFGLIDVCPNNSDFVFFDSFEGLPEATELDGGTAIRLQKENELWHNNNTASYDLFMSDLDKFGLSKRGVTVHKGWFEDTLPKFDKKKQIGVLRLDGDWYESTYSILDNLYDQVVEGGLILIDDYHDWQGCSLAVHDYLATKKKTDVICQSYPSNVAYILKKSNE